MAGSDDTSGETSRPAIPWVACVLFAVFIAVFAIEYKFATAPGRGHGAIATPTLLALGGLSHIAIMSFHQWYRLLTAPFLHTDPMHLFSNGLVLLCVGYPLEQMIGHKWFFALFMVGALGGSLLSLIISPADTVVVGASGGALALFGALFVFAFQLPRGMGRTKLIALSVLLAAVAMVPNGLPAKGTHIDYASHIGGLSAGLFAALFLRYWRPEGDALTRRGILADAMCLATALLLGLGVWSIVSHYPQFRLMTVLIPAAELPSNVSEQQQHAESLVIRYPRDPRAHFFMGALLQSHHDSAGAEHEYRIALQQADSVAGLFDRPFVNMMRALLAESIDENRQHALAREVAQPFCVAPPSEQPEPRVLELLKRAELCD